MQPRHLAVATVVALASELHADAAALVFNHEWTFSHTAATGSKSLGSEIVAFDSQNQRLWVVGTDANAGNKGFGGIDVLDLNGNLIHTIDTTLIGGVNSVAVKNGQAAVAFTAPVKTDAGVVRFYEAGSFGLQSEVRVGANPDSVIYTPDGSRLLVANEGEPITYPGADPEGSISLINTATFTSQTADFSAFNGQAAALASAGVRLNGPGATVAQDLEPEYIAVSADGTTAFATLQEANALARIDIGSATVTAIVPMGTKDHNLPGNGLDASDRDGTGNQPKVGNILNWKAEGLYMPDGVASLVKNGNQFYVTANEGDDRNDWGPDDVVRVSDLPASAFDSTLNNSLIAAHGADWRTNNDKLSRLNISLTGDTDNDGDLDVLQPIGARSFSILDANGQIVFDSGDQIEQIVKAQFPSLWDDSRSDNKGPEPESVTLGNVGGRDLLFVGLERSNAVMVWDLTQFQGSSSDQIKFVEMLFAPGDVGPEGLSFFNTPQGSFLAVANEVSETTSLFRISIPDGGSSLVLAGISFASLLGFSRRLRPEPTTAR